MAPRSAVATAFFLIRGYPVLLVLASPLSGDHFTTGTWMSLLAGGLTGALGFGFFRRLFGRA